MVKFNKKIGCVVISSAMAVLATGCATIEKADQSIKKADEQTSKNFDLAMEKVQKNAYFKKEKGFWVNPEPLPTYNLGKEVQLPEVFFKKAPATYPGMVSLNEIVADLSRLGVTIHVSSNAYPPVAAGAVAGVAAMNPQITVSDFVHRGDLKTALDVLTAKLGLFWKWKDGKVEIFKFETRTFYISALAGTSTISSSISMDGSGTSGGGASGGTSGSATAAVTSTASIATWGDVKNFLQGRLSNGGSLTIMESTGMISIKDTPNVLNDVEKSIKELNALLNKQINFNVEIYAVSLDDSDDVGLDINLLYKAFQAPASSGSSSSTAFPDLTGKGRFQTGAAGLASSTFNIFKGNWAGSSATIKTLSTIGNTKLVNKFPLTTLNGQSVPIVISNEKGYLKSSKTTPGVNGQPPTTELEPGTVTSGIGINLLPKIQPNGEILLKFNMNLSELVDISKVDSGQGNIIQTPERNIKAIEEKLSVKNGETVILAGFQHINDAVNKSGPLSAQNIVGGSQKGKITKQQLLIIISPYIQNNN